MVKRRDSLAARIMMLTMIAVLCSGLVIGTIGIYSIKTEGDRDASRHMNLICDDQSKALNEFLNSVEQSVSLAARYATDDIDSVKLLRGGVIGADGYILRSGNPQTDPKVQETLDTYLDEHTARVRAVLRSSATYTQGVYSYFYRINPQLSGKPIGFFLCKKNQESFSRVALTNLSAYAEDDEGHVAWYYEPLKAGKQLWMKPYYDENIGIKIISFVIPIYKAGTFIGVVGMDISFDTLVELLGNISVYESGYAYLAEENGTIVWHPTLSEGVHHETHSTDLKPIGSILRSAESSGERTITYSFMNEKKELAFTTLANGMKLIVVAPSAEINASWHPLITRIILAGLLVMTVFSGVTMVMADKIITPLRRLTEASQQLSQGNYDVVLDYDRADEVGMLTDAFRKLTEHLKSYISDLNSRVYRDALTGVRNKGGFEIFCRKLNDAIADEEHRPSFAVIMFDCDGLKRINDVYGHEKGDIYLQNACQLICKTFTHSPVFRIGGDEFVAVLQQEDFIRRLELLHTFERRAEAANAAAQDPWNKINISKGAVIFDPAQDENVESTLSRADAGMYADKKARKQNRETA